MATAADSDGTAEKPKATEPTAGERLRAAREKGDMSIRDAARLLHLDYWMVEALESDDFDALGAPVFAKGHMRTYALLLGLDPDDLMMSYYQSQGTTEAPPIVGKVIRTQGRRIRLPWASLAVGLLALAVVSALVWWFFLRESPVAGSASVLGDVATDARVSRELQVPSMSAVAANRPASQVVPLTVAAEPVVEASVQQSVTRSKQGEADTAPLAAAQTTESLAAPLSSARAAVQPASPAPGEVHLRLQFRGDSWVEVHDATGSRLLWDLRRSGAIEELRGQPPIEIFLGRAAEVTLEVNGEPFVIPAASRRRDTARFRVVAP